MVLPDPAGPDAARGAARPRCVLRGVDARASTRAAARSTCGSGWPSGSPDELAARPALAGAPWITWLRPAPRRAGRPEVDLHTRAAGHRLPHARRGRARSSPRSTSAGYWIDGDVLHIGEVRVGARGPGRRAVACCAPAPTSATTPRSRPARRSSAGCPTGEFWSGCTGQRGSSGAARGPWSERPPSPRPGSARVRRAGRRCCRLLPSLAVAGRRCCSPSRAADLRHGRARRLGVRGPPAVAARPPRSSATWCWRCWSWPLVRRAAAGLDAGRPPGAQQGRRSRSGPPCGCSTRRAPGSSRSTPAQLTPTWLRLLGARIGADVEASTVLMIPALTHGQRPRVPGRRHPDRRLRARWRLAARRARQDRQARLRRQLRHGRAGPQGAEARPWSRCCRPRRRARPLKAGESWLGSPPAPLRRAERQGVGRAHLRPADPAARSPARRGRRPRLLPVPVSVGLLRRRRPARARGPGPRRPGAGPARGRPGARSLAGVVAAAGRRRREVAARRSDPARRRTRCGASFVWRNELADTFVEVRRRPVVRPRRAPAPRCSTLWFRLMGATDRPRRVVRDLLAARARPGRARRRRDRQPGQRGADPPVPRPGAGHGRRAVWSGRDPRAQLA